VGTPARAGGGNGPLGVPRPIWPARQAVAMSADSPGQDRLRLRGRAGGGTRLLEITGHGARWAARWNDLARAVDINRWADQVQGAEPLFFLDYYASGKLDVPAAAEVIESIARALSVNPSRYCATNT